VRFHKIDLNQPDPAGAPKDAFEAVELRVGGAFQAGVTTLAGCGVATLSPFDADADAAGVCGAGAAPYHELAIGDLVIPASGFVVVGNIPASDRPWNNVDGAPSSVLKNGPDYLTLRGPGGDVVDAVSYADNDAPEIHASCPDLASALQIPADTNTEDSPALNQVLALCQDGSWQLLLESTIAWKSANTCGSGAGGSGAAGSSAGGSSAGGSGGSGGAGGSAGSGEAGTSAAGGSGGGAGGSTGGGAGGSVSGGGANSGGATSGAAGSQAGGPDGFEMNPAEDGDCSCQAPGARGPVRGAFPLLALGLLAARRRRGA
jgi:MYXO-CTERM domain-containing protein